MSIGVGGTWTSVKTMTKGVEADRTARIPAVGGFVKDNNEIPKYVTQARAANLLGLPPGEICRLSQEVGVGHMEKAGAKEEWYFTYEELQKIRMYVRFDERGVKTEAWFDY
jgi:hypothetical protein